MANVPREGDRDILIAIIQAIPQAIIAIAAVLNVWPF
jgi:hypothetical protein